MLKRLGPILSSPFTWLILFALGSATLVSVGLSIIYGLPVGLISAGAYFMVFSTVIFRGIGNG
jgi:hypothetical protein